ncbi:hypothetical protein [Anaerospora hongkongensis]|uniref:hypothetical protein n=1 Tax=Anaerospora hongkongensis TaxID=244830 RepID=UPI002FD9A4F2
MSGVFGTGNVRNAKLQWQPAQQDVESKQSIRSTTTRGPKLKLPISATVDIAI